MKKYLLVILIILFYSFSAEAARGFGAKVYNENNVNFANVIVDYDYNKIKVQTNNQDFDYFIIERISNMDKTVLYLYAVLASSYKNGNYDKSKTETFVFDTKNYLFSTYSTTKKRRFEMFKLEQNL
jgi:hypothetical protein